MSGLSLERTAVVPDTSVIVKWYRQGEVLADRALALRDAYLDGQIAIAVLPRSRGSAKADWARQCRRAGLYKVGRALYEKGGFGFDKPGQVGAMEVAEDYQVCVRRSG